MADSTFKDTELDSPINSLCLALLASEDNGQGGRYYMEIGTAFWIMPGLALTAKHVVEAPHKEFHHPYYRYNPNNPKPLFSGRSTNVSYTIEAFQVLKGGKLGGKWDARHFFPCQITDIAVLFLQPASNATYDNCIFPTLNLLPPPVGSLVSAFGYHQIKLEDNGQRKVVTLGGVTTRGPLTEIFHDQRDDGALNMPCFEITGRLDSGMSGGPALNERGQVCGVNMYSPPSYSGERDVSYFASLWPALATQIIGIECPSLPGSKDFFLYELLECAPPGAIANLDKFTLTRKEGREGADLQSMYRISDLNLSP